MTSGEREASWWSRMFGAREAGGTGEAVDARGPSGASVELSGAPDPPDGIEVQMRALVSENDALRSRLEELRSTYESVRDELAAERGQRRAIEASHRGMLEQARKVQSAAHRVEEEKRHLVARLEETSAHMERTQTELAARTEACGTLERRAEAAEKSSATSRRAAEAARLQVEQSNRKTRQLNKELKALQAELEQGLEEKKVQARSLEQARQRVKILEEQLARTKERVAATAGAQQEIAERLDAVQRRRDEAERAVEAMTANLTRERETLARARAVARRFAQLASRALHMCVGDRLALPLRLAWDGLSVEPRPDRRSAAREVASTMKAAGLCTSVEFDTNPDGIDLELTLVPQIAADVDLRGVPRWLAEYGRACLLTRDGPPLEISEVHVDASRRIVRAALVQRPGRGASPDEPL